MKKYPKIIRFCFLQQKKLKQLVIAGQETAVEVNDSILSRKGASFKTGEI